MQTKYLNISSYINIYKMATSHSPTLDSIKMVEQTVKKYSQEYGKYQLWKKLPKQMMYQTFQSILDYLEESNKIIIDNEGIIIWTYDPKTIKKLVNNNLIFRWIYYLVRKELNKNLQT